MISQPAHTPSPMGQPLNVLSGKIGEQPSGSYELGPVIEAADDMAEQFNLMALSAAIEAAKARQRALA